MALVVHREKLFFTRADHCPVGTLIEGIWNQFPDDARYITRNRIHTQQPLTPLCEGMLMVAAKRASVISPAEYKNLWDTFIQSKTPVEILRPVHQPQSPPFKFDDRYTIPAAMEVAKRLAELSPMKIGAVLLNFDQQIVSFGWNNHFKNRVQHAEILLVKNFISQSGLMKIPRGYTLVTTLEPCAMCAGYLHEYCEDLADLKIIFDQADPGPFAQSSILKPGSHLHGKHFGSRT